MRRIIDVIPDYIRRRFPTHIDLQKALQNGDVVYDDEGNLRLRVEVYPQTCSAQEFNQSAIYTPAHPQQYASSMIQQQQLYDYPYIPLFLAEPEEQPDIESNDKQILEGQQFDFFNIEGVNVCFKMLDLDGQLSYISMVNAEDIARGAGLVQSQTKLSTESCGKSYEFIRWNTFNEYAQEAIPTLILDRYYEPILSRFIPEKIGKGSWIPTALAVLIVMRCTSKKAREFQKIVSIKITNELNILAAKKYNLMMDLMKKQIKEYDEKINYQDSFLNKDGLLNSSEIASHFGMTAQELHRVLYKAGVIQKNQDIWIVKAPYNDFAYTRLIDIDTPAGKKTVTYWTECGRGWIHGILASLTIFPGQNNKQKIDEYLKR